MSKDINYTLRAVIPICFLNGEQVVNIEAVQDWYKVKEGKEPEREYCKEVAEITYKDGHRKYADIGCDSNITAAYDVLAVIQGIKPQSTHIQRIVRGVYDMPD